MSELERIATAANPEAEALIDLMEPHEKRWIEPALRRALAAERRATVERIRTALGNGEEFADALNTAGALRRRMSAILDEEAAR